MKRTAAILFTLLAALLLATPSHALSPEAQSAITWLESTQNQSGSWGNTPTSTTTEHLSTTAAIEALTAVFNGDGSIY